MNSGKEQVDRDLLLKKILTWRSNKKVKELKGLGVTLILDKISVSKLLTLRHQTSIERIYGWQTAF